MRYVWSKCKSYNVSIITGSQSPSALTRDLLLDRYRRTLWAQIMCIMIQWWIMHFWYNFVWIVHSLFTAPFKFKKFNVWAVHSVWGAVGDCRQTERQCLLMDITWAKGTSGRGGKKKRCWKVGHPWGEKVSVSQPYHQHTPEVFSVLWSCWDSPAWQWTWRRWTCLSA